MWSLVPLPGRGLCCPPLHGGDSAAEPNPRSPPSLGLLLHDVTMAGLQELRFPEEKPLLRGQDAAELVSCPFGSWGGGRHLVAKKETACLPSGVADGKEPADHPWGAASLESSRHPEPSPPCCAFGCP